MAGLMSRFASCVSPRHAGCIGERVLIAEVVGGKGAFVLRVGEGQLRGSARVLT